MPFFSVIIPTYNRADLIGQTLDSVFRQEFTDYEVIVVDDGSTDDTLRVLEPYGDRIKLLRQANKGPGAARNLGVREARGEYIAFLDSDDLWFPWTLGTYLEAIQRANGPTILLGAGNWFQERKEIVAVAHTSLGLTVYSDFFSSSRDVLWVGSGGLVARRSELDEVGGFLEVLRVAEDLDLFLRMGMHAGFAVVTTPRTFGYRQHVANSINDVASVVRCALRLVDAERSGRYPGGAVRSSERLEILTRFLRPPSLAALRVGKSREAWQIYWATFAWHIRLWRWKYIMGFALRALGALLSRGTSLSIKPAATQT